MKSVIKGLGGNESTLEGLKKKIIDNNLEKELQKYYHDLMKSQQECQKLKKDLANKQQQCQKLQQEMETFKNALEYTNHDVPAFCTW